MALPYAQMTPEQQAAKVAQAAAWAAANRERRREISRESARRRRAAMSPEERRASRRAPSPQQAARAKAWREANPERAKETQERYRRKKGMKARKPRDLLARAAYQRQYEAKRTPAQRSAKWAKWASANKDKIAAYRRMNAARHAERQRRRTATTKHATPSWANIDAIRAVYETAARLSRETGVPHEVDHVIPLRGQTVCGLHVETNLQVLTATANQKKGARFAAGH